MVLKPRTWEEGTQALVTWTVETAFGPQQWSEGWGWVRLQELQSGPLLEGASAQTYPHPVGQAMITHREWHADVEMGQHSSQLRMLGRDNGLGVGSYPGSCILAKSQRGVEWAKDST